MTLGKNREVFAAVRAKIIPEGSSPDVQQMLEALLVQATFCASECSEAAVLESVGQAFDALEKALHPNVAKARTLFQRMKAEGKLPQPYVQDPTAMSMLTPMKGVVARSEGRLILGPKPDLQTVGCTCIVADAEGQEHGCSLLPRHEGAHHDKQTGWFWSLTSDGGVLMSKPGE